MNLDQLSATFEANKVPILATAAAGVAGLALWQRHKAGSSSTSTPAQGVATVPSYSAGSQLAATTGAGGVYDSSSSDLYGAIQPQLESLGSQVSDLNSKLNSVPVSTAPSSPIAGSLFAPSSSTNIVRYGDGNIVQVQSDGSQLSLTPDEWRGLYSKGVAFDQLTQQSAGGQVFSVQGNLSGRYPVPAPATSTPAS